MAESADKVEAGKPVPSTLDTPTDSSAVGSPTPSPVESDGGRALARICPVCEKTYPAEFMVCPRDAARLEDLGGAADDDPLIGAVLGGTFRVLAAIGEGATARVYEARHLRLGKKRFAVKVLHAGYSGDPTVVARFQREAEAAAGIAHPGVVDVYDVNRTSDGGFYIATELLEGRDLSSILRDEGKLEVTTAVRIARGVCSALAAAHELGIVHRDIKPGNVFVLGDLRSPTIKVLDFGISKIDDNANLTRTGMIVGTPAYMAPEQAAGKRVDGRTDVYAVGALLFHCLTGRTPFVADAEDGSDEGAQVLSQILSQEPPRPRSLRPSLPDTLELVVQRAMAKQIGDRHGSIVELDHALAPFDRDTRARAAKSAAVVVDDSTAGRSARAARPLLVMLTLATLALSVVLLDAAMLSLLASGEPDPAAPKLGRLIGVTFASIALLVAPLVLWLRHLGKIWQNTPRAMLLAQRLQKALAAALVGYAVAAIALRLLDLVVLGGSGGLGPFGDFAVTLASALGGAAGFITGGERTRPS